MNFRLIFNPETNLVHFVTTNENDFSVKSPLYPRAWHVLLAVCANMQLMLN